MSGGSDVDLAPVDHYRLEHFHVSEAAHTPTISCPPHPPNLTPDQARELARHLLDQADTVSPRDSTFTQQQILLELDALRTKVSDLAQAYDEHLPPLR